MVHDSGETVSLRLWPPVAIGAPLLVGWLATLLSGDPVDLGAWRVPLSGALVLFFVGWNGWSLRLFGRHETGLLPGACDTLIDRRARTASPGTRYAWACSRYTSGWRSLAPTFWGLVLFPAAR